VVEGKWNSCCVVDKSIHDLYWNMCASHCTIYCDVVDISLVLCLREFSNWFF
jgi:hypothetical protein